jgi:DNA-binding CsgD family transcriptional regulator
VLEQSELLRAKHRFVSAGEITESLFAELTMVARFLIRNGHLPPSYAPYGQWDEEASRELLQEWVAEKLLRAGGLAAIFDSAANPKGFRVLAERSLRQFVLNRRQRSQSQNLYERTMRLLKEDQRFEIAHAAERPQDIVWVIRDQPPRAAFGGSERELLAFAYSLGEFELIHYKVSAEKLAPLLAAEELARFTIGMINAAGPLSLGQLMAALELRFDLAPVSFHSLQSENPPEPEPGRSLEDEVVGRASGLAAIAELTSRQSQVLLLRRAEVTIEETATELGCSVGTVVNEQEAIARVLRRHCQGTAEESELLKIVGDLLYEGSGG